VVVAPGRTVVLVAGPMAVVVVPSESDQRDAMPVHESVTAVPWFTTPDGEAVNDTMCGTAATRATALAVSCAGRLPGGPVTVKV
jgi:hypothetical protein